MTNNKLQLLGSISALVASALFFNMGGKENGYQAAQTAQVAIGDYDGDGKTNDISLVQNDGKVQIFLYSPKVESQYVHPYGAQRGEDMTYTNAGWTKADSVKESKLVELSDKYSKMEQRAINDLGINTNKYEKFRISL